MVKISAWGASLALRIPISIVEEFDLKAGEYFKIDSNERGEIILWPAKDDVASISAAAVKDLDSNDMCWHGEDVLNVPEGW